MYPFFAFKQQYNLFLRILIFSFLITFCAQLFKPLRFMMIRHCRMEGLNQTYQDKLFCHIGTAITEQVFFISLFATLIRLIGTFLPSTIYTFSLHKDAFLLLLWSIFCWVPAVYQVADILRWVYFKGFRSDLLKEPRRQGKFAPLEQISAEFSFTRWNCRVLVGVSVSRSHRVSC